MLSNELKERGLIFQVTSEDVYKKIDSEEINFYIGFDPTAHTLHVGSLLPILFMHRMIAAGHKPTALVGGFTGMIGDPSGKVSERVLLDTHVIDNNTQALKNLLTKLLPGIEVISNADWNTNMDLITYLRDYGKYFNINQMIAKDIVASRLETGISYAEFSYQIIQAIDFYKLNKSKNITMQVGGSDQWGNIVSGLDLIRKKTGSNHDIFGMTLPLVTKKDGTKFGKSESGAVWLTKEDTNVYDFYQFWLNVADDEVIKYLKMYTTVPLEEISRLETCVAEEPFKREAQKSLAAWITTFVHSEEDLKLALEVTNYFFGKETELTKEHFDIILDCLETKTSNHENVVEALLDAKIVNSKREVREFISSGALALNGVKLTSEEEMINKFDKFDNKTFIVKKGKKNYFILKLEN